MARKWSFFVSWSSRCVNAVIQGQKIARLAAAVHAVDQPDTGDYAVGVARVLALGHFDEAAVLFVLYAVVHQQKRLVATYNAMFAFKKYKQSPVTVSRNGKVVAVALEDMPILPAS